MKPASAVKDVAYVIDNLVFNPHDNVKIVEAYVCVNKDNPVTV
jgi:hypothetical protein